MDFWIILGFIGTIYLILEISFYFIVSFVRKHFQWLIIKSDENPSFSKEGLSKFISQGYDSELGWIRKPNTSSKEKNKNFFSEWSINNKGSRTNPGFEDQNSLISCYGDSFTFCRQVNDDETWEHFLSQANNSNVQNFGVGNYGIDQSLLRLKREFVNNPTKIVIIGVVPDTISRIMSYWKHYYEYGNTFAFKPKFKLDNGKLILLPNKIDDPKKFDTVENYLKEIQKEDFFYKLKFSKEIIKFPYVFRLLKNFKRNFRIIYWVLLIQLKKSQGKETSHLAWNPMKPIMDINLNWRLSLYNNKDSLAVFYSILEEYSIFSIKENFIPIFTLIPQKDDLIFIKNNSNYLNNFLNSLNGIQNLHVIDILTELINEPNLDELFSDDNEYGGHPNKKGNKLISKVIQNYLVKENLLKN